LVCKGVDIFLKPLTSLIQILRQSVALCNELIVPVPYLYYYIFYWCYIFFFYLFGLSFLVFVLLLFCVLFIFCSGFVRVAYTVRPSG
jgi:hypothetical protein